MYRFQSNTRFVIPSFVLNDGRPRNQKFVKELQKSLKDSDKTEINIVEELSAQTVLTEYANLLKSDGLSIEENRALLKLLDKHEDELDEIIRSHIYYGLFEGYPGVFLEDLSKPGGPDLYKEMQVKGSYYSNAFSVFNII